MKKPHEILNDEIVAAIRKYETATGLTTHTISLYHHGGRVRRCDVSFKALPAKAPETDTVVVPTDSLTH